ncbi:MAG: HRDC domain-containing protein, partial [Calditrichaeota bacterium]|nr:HRDC domain-containing protein [Calditrichota bacterium]
ERCGMCDNCLSEKQEKIDITVPAQKFLSCVFRTGQRFGAAHIIDVLRGSRNQKVQQFSHDRLTTYGIGKEFSKKQWSHLSRQLVRQGLLEKEPAYGGLKLTQRAGEVFAGRAKVFGTIQEEPLAPARAETPANYDAALFELLREKRKALADAANVPPYVIFSDKSLIDMASFFPQSAARFSDMHGVGQVKLERYGAGFLEIIRNYCREHNLSEVPASRSTAPARTSRKTPLQKLRHQVVGEAFRGGASLEDLMAEYGTKRSTLISYLYQYYQEGQRLPAERLLPASQLPPAQREKVLQIFERLGTQKLRPVFDALNGEVAYEELHILRLYYLNRKKIK